MSMIAIAEPSAQFCAVWNWLGDQLADHVALRAAEHGRGDVVAHQRDVDEQHARDDARVGRAGG